MDSPYGIIPYEELENDYYESLMEANAYQKLILAGAEQEPGKRNMREVVLGNKEIMETILLEIERGGMSTDSFERFVLQI